MMDKGVLLRHYKQPSIQEALLSCAEDKEIAVRYGDGGFGKRPETLIYPRDIIEFVQQGATSFHCSEELWENPLRLHTEMKKVEIDNLRKGWDLVLDIDCPFLEYSFIAGDLLVHALRYHGIESLSIKFSGNHGFHIGVPFEAFPEAVNGKPTRLLFPDGPRKIAGYLKEMIREHLAERILAREELKEIQQKIGKSFKELVVNGKFDPFSVLDIDTILISSRHLYRMPYSFNEKSGLISVPIKPEKILKFAKEKATPGKVEVGKEIFLGRKNIIPGEARKLIVQAFDFKMPRHIIQIDATKLQPERTYEEIKGAISEECFPPIIKKILEGKMEDGKKRVLFVLVNFLTCVGWEHDKVLERLKKWNNTHPNPLSETLIVGQVRYHKQQKKRILPPNFDNDQYYGFVQVDDTLSKKFKNPVNYTLWRARHAKKASDEKKRVKKEN